MHKQHRMGVRFGFALLAVTLFVAWALPEDARSLLIGLLLAMTAGIYLGFAWMDGRPPWVVLEGIIAVVFLAIALAGLTVSTLFLAAGFGAHVLWDLLHHPRAIDTRVARWVPPACLVYDVGVALAVFWWWPPL